MLDHNAYQRRYYGRPERVRSRMAPVATRYVLRHLDRVFRPLELAPGPYDAAVGFFFLHHLRSVAELARGVARVLRPAFESAGFEDVEIHRYGLFPPALGNRAGFARLEEGVERLRLLEGLLAFQIVTGIHRGRRA